MAGRSEAECMEGGGNDLEAWDDGEVLVNTDVDATAGTLSMTTELDGA